MDDIVQAIKNFPDYIGSNGRMDSEIVTHKNTGKTSKPLYRKGSQDLEKVQKTQNANRMLTVFPKSE